MFSLIKRYKITLAKEMANNNKIIKKLNHKSSPLSFIKIFLIYIYIYIYIYI